MWLPTAQLDSEVAPKYTGPVLDMLDMGQIYLEVMTPAPNMTQTHLEVTQKHLQVIQKHL